MKSVGKKWSVRVSNSPKGLAGQLILEQRSKREDDVSPPGPVRTVPSRIEAYENGRRAAFSHRSPLLSGSPFTSGDSALEKYADPAPAEYQERQITTHILFLFDCDPVETEWRTAEERFRGSVRSGDMWLVPRFAPHSGLLRGAHGGLALSLGHSTFERHVGRLMHGGRLELAPQFALRDPALEHLVHGLSSVVQDGPLADPLVGELLLNAVCLRLAKRHATSELNFAPRRGGLPPIRLKRVLAYIESNLHTAISLTALASVAEMSLYYFATLFKQSTGLSPHQYVIRRRMHKAKELLLTTKRSVLDIALSLGFQHESNFTRAFRHTSGAAPSEYRRALS